METWRETHQPAGLEERLENGIVKCHLSPRNCVIREGQHGFCGVRGNRSGRLVTFNYGKAVHATEETIETEAVHHFAPGERILSMGNIGCMLNCVYCHNWKTSQSRHVADADIHHYTPEMVIDIAKRHNIRVISWTYNDPVVWHEFILDTAKLAKQEGMINLYKSAFYISPEAVDELLPHIDIFSISVKSMSPEYYRKMTTGRLEPVLAATRQVFEAGKHVEVSTLMITDISDDVGTAQAVADWVLNRLGSHVPVHFVRFHPDYKLRDTIRTPIPRLEAACRAAVDMGLEHVYMGNAYDQPWSNTYCRGCGVELINRYGLNAAIVGLDERGACRACGRSAHMTLLPAAARQTEAGAPDGSYATRDFTWHGDIRSLHAQVRNESADTRFVFHARRVAEGQPTAWTRVPLGPGESYRFIIAKSRPDELGPTIALPPGVVSNLHEVFDRAHFPTVSADAAPPPGDVTPLPLYAGRLLTPVAVQMRTT